eukprot:TRINITY_DN28664_c0_g1_i1.p1 TRINITY_DN28664_c0_g1~~TRINITY_DN28664_c0_g1_i1.p1  ORF type:complete len:467 (+),score=83.15 TRINITY_DN28664_c0_g1_i1:83-1483(+)
MRTKVVGKYDLRGTIGSGPHGKVKLAIDRDDGSAWAVKVLRLEALGQGGAADEAMAADVATARLLHHPYLACLREVLVSPSRLYLVYEMVEGGDLVDRLLTARRLDEPRARHHFRQLCLGVAHCHQQGVPHGAITPGNLLLDSAGSLKLTHGGLPTLRSRLRAAAGAPGIDCASPQYNAPETLLGAARQQGPDGEKADVWACGVILYLLVAGKLPFDEESTGALLSRAERCEFRLPRQLSAGVRDLLSQILSAEPERRPGIEQVLSHPWCLAGAEGGEPRFAARRAAPSAQQVDRAITAVAEARPWSHAGAARRGSRRRTSVAAADVQAAEQQGGAQDPGGCDEYQRTWSHVLWSGPCCVVTASFAADPLGLVRAALESLGGCPVDGSNTGELRGCTCGAARPLSYSCRVTPRAVSGTATVTLRRDKGAHLDFHHLWRRLGEALGPCATLHRCDPPAKGLPLVAPP